jgi:hypothetical protein
MEWLSGWLLSFGRKGGGGEGTALEAPVEPEPAEAQELRPAAE